MFKNGGHIISHLHECVVIEKWPQLAVYQVIKLSNMFLCRDTYYIVTSVKFSYTQALSHNHTNYHNYVTIVIFEGGPDTPEISTIYGNRGRRAKRKLSIILFANNKVPITEGFESLCVDASICDGKETG